MLVVFQRLQGLSDDIVGKATALKKSSPLRTLLAPRRICATASGPAPRRSAGLKAASSVRARRESRQQLPKILHAAPACVRARPGSAPGARGAAQPPPPRPPRGGGGLS